MAKTMRCGFTTGSCAAAAAKAALLLLTEGKIVTDIELHSPQGERILVPVLSVEFIPSGGAMATVIKDSGDDPDITNGMPVVAEVKIDKALTDLRLVAGEGVGVVTKAGLSVPVGLPAINPGPQRMIEEVVQSVLGAGKFCEVKIILPEGARLAKRTLNPILGIEGGLSVIGTTGIVRPMSEEAFKDSLVPQISVAKAAGYDTLVFVPGKIGETAAVIKYGLPQACVVQTSNFIGHMLENAVDQQIRKVLLFGHLGKIVKVAAGVFYTHNRIADARMETLSAYLALLGASQDIVRQVLAMPTTEAAIELIEANGLQAVYSLLAERASLRAARYTFDDLTIGTGIITLQGEMLGYDATACRIGEELGWNIKS